MTPFAPLGTETPFERYQRSSLRTSEAGRDVVGTVVTFYVKMDFPGLMNLSTKKVIC
jgi:hypothetical protein